MDYTMVERGSNLARWINEFSDGWFNRFAGTPELPGLSLRRGQVAHDLRIYHVYGLTNAREALKVVDFLKGHLVDFMAGGNDEHAVFRKHIRVKDHARIQIFDRDRDTLCFRPRNNFAMSADGAQGSQQLRIVQTSAALQLIQRFDAGKPGFFELEHVGKNFQQSRADGNGFPGNGVRRKSAAV